MTEKARRLDSWHYITNRRRANFWLPKAVAWLRQIPGMPGGARFDLQLFGNSTPRSISEGSVCGFKGSAAGWATMEPTHRKAGLRLVKPKYGNAVPAFKGAFGYQALAVFYGLSYEAAEVALGNAVVDWGSGYGKISAVLDPYDPIAAAERIERFCADFNIQLMPVAEIVAGPFTFSAVSGYTSRRRKEHHDDR